ncbi:MAG: hypothetical protein FD152_2393 [Xanthobacteraceae bacterium]|nr:MAG: hypothetical protein FD152_2393 [Xanthobacteraceae bacterium]
MALPLDFDWHDGKAASNQTKHGVSFEDARQVFLDPRRIDVDASRAVDGEERRKTTGLMAGKLLSVVYAPRGNVVWIISARRANPKEIRSYVQS